MHADIARHRDALIALCRRYDVARLEVFGSAARGDDFDPARSDADFLVTFKPDSRLPPLEQFLGFAEALEALLGRPVELSYRLTSRRRSVRWLAAHACVAPLAALRFSALQS